MAQRAPVGADMMIYHTQVRALFPLSTAPGPEASRMAVNLKHTSFL